VLGTRVNALEQTQASNSAILASSSAQLAKANELTNSLSEKITSQEALLKNLQNLSSNSGSGNFSPASLQDLGLDHMDINTATISSTLFVLGRTTLADLGVTGSISAGVLTIKGLNDDATASINTLSGDLKLQNEGLGGIDILSGKVVVDKNGNVNIQNSLTAKEVNTEKLNITINSNASSSATLSASTGISTITKNTNSVTIKTTAITKDSLIYVTFNGDYSPAVRYWTEGKVAGNSFTIKLDAPVAKDVKLNWWIVN
jgi:hypothetical protein